MKGKLATIAWKQPPSAAAVVLNAPPQDGPLQRNAFDPLAQHRDWCPWVNAVKEAATHTGAAPLPGEDSVLAQQGWKAALDLLLPMKKNSNQSEGSLAQASV